MAELKPFTPEEQKLLRRFCLYGFLKNQMYFEPFLILAFLDKGLSFTAIGTLVAVRSVCTNLMEIPSGAIADTLGRRRSLIASFAAYAISFACFAFGTGFLTFLPAMVLFAIGEAFRTGTHKAILFDWLTRLGRKDDKVRVYGITRSWSKIGSAVSVIVAAGIYIATGDFTWLFLLAIPPYIANILNFLAYPRELDGSLKQNRSAREVVRILWKALKSALTRPGLRALMLESSFLDGFFNAVKDYLQPLLKAAALALPIAVAAPDTVRLAVLVGGVNFLLYAASSVAARNSHKVAKAAGDEDATAIRLWAWTLALYLLMGAGFLVPWSLLAIGAFVVMEVMRNVWKPVMVSRFHTHSELDSAATTLSVANQCKTLTVALVAPLLGWTVDLAASAWNAGDAETIALVALWPVAAFGILSSAFGWAFARKQRHLPPGEGHTPSPAADTAATP